MPWKECKPMDERLRFIARLLEGEKMAPLCREFGKMNMIRIITSLAVACVFFCASSAVAATYEIDTTHAQIQFKVKHLGISSVRGVFKDFAGTFEYDPKNVQASKANAKIKTISIDTENKKRDDHLRSADFLDADGKPEISFVSKEIKDVNDQSFTLVGDLTIRGVTKLVELKTEFGGTATDPWGKERAAFSASTTINRKDFGIVWNKVLETGGLVVGEDVKIEIDVEGVKK